MDGTIKPPAPLSNKGDMVENWIRWKKDFIIFIELSNYNDKPQEIKAFLLRNYIGEFGQSVIQKIVFENTADRDDMHKLLTKLDAHFNPNEIVARYSFLTRYKKQNESIEDYISDLKNKAEICNFGKLTNGLIRDHIIAHLGDKTLRQKLFAVKNLDLSKLVSIYNEHYAGIVQKQPAPSDDTKQNEVNRKCWRCNTKHVIKKCPAWNFKCGNCGELHHFTRCCKKNSPPKQETPIRNKCNPNENVYLSNTNLRTGNIRHGNAIAPQALRPSAPPLPPSYGNQLYPYLNNISTQSESIPTSVTTPANVNGQCNVSEAQAGEKKVNTEDKCTLS